MGYNDDRHERAKKAAEDMMRAINEMGFDVETFVETIISDHRTLQQIFGTVVKEWAKKNAEMEESQRFDLRNEATVKMGADIHRLIGDKYWLPYI